MPAVLDRVEITGPRSERYVEVLSPRALGLLVELHDALAGRRAAALAARRRRQAELSGGGMLDFLHQTRHIRADASWRVAPPAPGLVDRRVEITGPTDRKMTINALNSGANVWLADFEDANTPLWSNMIEGQLNLKDALDRTIDFTSDEGKAYQLRHDDSLATIVVRPRGWHLDEKHLLIDGRRASASLTDFALYMSACAQRQLDKGKGPYFYLPKLESHTEARLWNDCFNLAQDYLGIPRGTIRATALIETIGAAFEMDEILYELREHAAGLNAGRWDYLFSVIKKFRTRGTEFILPDRNAVTMTAPFMRAYTELLVQTCHKRGAFAMGGMAAFIPSRRHREVNEIALRKVREDKYREAGDGFDGSWVAHPDLVPVCREVFDEVLGRNPNQLSRQRPDVEVTAADLLAVDKTPGGVTEAGLRNNVSVALQYLSAWLGGSGAVGIEYSSFGPPGRANTSSNGKTGALVEYPSFGPPGGADPSFGPPGGANTSGNGKTGALVFNLMEDAATAEISRSQVWQWIHNEVTLDEGPLVTRDLVERMIDEELAKISELEGDSFDTARYGQAVALFTEVALADSFAEFLTLPAYERMP